MIETLIVVSALALMLDARLRSALVAYAVLTGTTLWLAFPHGANTGALALFAFLALVKLVVGPALVLAIVRRYGVPENLGPSFNLAWRVLGAVAAVGVGAGAATMPAFASIPFAGVVFTALFCSVAVVVLHRNLLAHVIGLLALGSAISLAGAVFAPGLAGATEIADTFDVVIATLVALSVARSLVAFDPRLDIRSLRELRG